MLGQISILSRLSIRLSIRQWRSRRSRRSWRLPLAIVMMWLAGALVIPSGVRGLSTTVVISQVYNGGGSGATWKNDYVELFNRGTADVSLNGMTIQYASATGTGSFSSSPVTALSGVLAPGQYYLVQLASGTAGVALVSPNATGTTNLAATGGKVALVSGTSGLACNGSSTPCSAAQLGQIIDLVGYGAANFFEGTVAPLPGATTAIIRGNQGCTETDNNGVDFQPGSAQPRNLSSPINTCASLTPRITVADVSRSEGDTGATSFNFTVSLSGPAPAGGVLFDIATIDGTAQDDNPTTEDNDYVARSLSGQTIAAGAISYTFAVTVSGDSLFEPNETFTVRITSVNGAQVEDGEALGTIVNDDPEQARIAVIQGTGASSLLVGRLVAVRGIVTGRKSNGFFVQEPDESIDGDPLTSEGIFVFSGSTPTSLAAVGNLVQVTGQVAEYVPATDPQQPPLTQLTQPVVTLVSTGSRLPEAVALTPAFPDSKGAFDQLERVEGMRVSIDSLTVSGPTQGSVDEVNATATSNGIFYGVVTGVSRPFREPGIEAPQQPPTGTIPPIPRFDGNPERIRVDSDGQSGGVTLDVGAGTIITGLVGPLDYGSRAYTLLPDPGLPLKISSRSAAAAVAAANGYEVTVATFNLQRFYNNVGDTAGAPLLTAAAWERRLRKASLAVRDYLRAPDIIGVVEVENLGTLQSLASRIDSDALFAGQPRPGYVGYLVEGNDVGGIDVGFLVKTAPVAGGTPRVAVGGVVQESATTRFTNPNGTTELLHDRPPLRLSATVNFPGGGPYSLTVIVNHLRSLNGITDTASGANGWATGGERVRAKRQKQAEDIATIIQSRQSANPAEPLIVLGDFNAFEFNDGYVDPLNTIGGTPPPDNQTVVPGDGATLVNPGLINMASFAPEPQRYSYVFEGNAQSLDHLLINNALFATTYNRRIEHPRINADFAETERSNGETPLRISDHDPAVGYFQVLAFPETEGDVSPRPGGSGRVTVSDWVQVGRFVVGLDGQPTDAEFRRIDCAPRGSFGDGRIDVADWVQAGRYASGIDPIVAVSGPLAGAMTAMDDDSPPRLLRLAMEKATVEGQLVTVPVTLRGGRGDEAAISFSLFFDPSTAQLHGVEAPPSSVVVVNGRGAGAGQVGVAITLDDQSADDHRRIERELLQLRFRSLARGPLALRLAPGPAPTNLASRDGRPLPLRIVDRP